LKSLALALVGALCWSSVVLGDESVWDGSVKSKGNSRTHPVTGTRGMVVADDRIAAEWGAEILRQGGNAVDAAVATAFAMSVTRPQHSTLGGGGFFVYCPAPRDGKASECQSMDYREEAPAAATRDMYVKDGKPRTDLSQNGALASGVPGVPAGLLTALKKFGKLPRQKILSRPIQLARKGMTFSSQTEAAANDRFEFFNDEAKRIFGCGKKDAPCAVGSLIKQSELAWVLEQISAKGRAGFYEGAVAQKLVAGLKAGGGIITLEDLKKYQPKFRKPVVGRFRDMEVVSMPPPSSGGAIVVQLLNYMERADRQGLLADGYGSARAIHAEASAMTLAFADRAKHFGDPDHYPVPLPTLLSPKYLDARWAMVKPDQFTQPADGGAIEIKDGEHTTHFSVIDGEGNAVAITTTINDNFGSGFVPPGTGVVMNNEMDDFSIQPGVPNLFGLVGGEANAVAPGKRPLSSMSPTIVRDLSGNARLVVGAAGGPRIITSTFQTIFNRLRFNLSIADALDAPRVHHQWKPEELKVERNGFGFEALARLKQMGHKIGEIPTSARAHGLERFPNGRVWGIADTRGEGAAVAE